MSSSYLFHDLHQRTAFSTLGVPFSISDTHASPNAMPAAPIESSAANEMVMTEMILQVTLVSSSSIYERYPHRVDADHVYD